MADRFLVAVVVASFGATYGVYAFVSSSGERGLEENQRSIPVQTGNLVNQVAIDGSIVFSNKETLSFGSQGTISEIQVEEGQEVTKGQSLVKLDSETIASLQQSIAQSRVNL